MKLLSLASILILALAVAAGCGGGEEDQSSSQSSSQAWADDFCSAAADWRTSLEGVVSGISPADLNAEAIQDAVDEGLEATESFLDDVRGLGRPETDAGQEVEAIVDSMADSVQTTVDDLRSEFEGADSLPDLIGKVGQVTAQIGALQEELQSSLDDLENVDTGELRQELESNEDCASARSGS